MISRYQLAIWLLVIGIGFVIPDGCWSQDLAVPPVPGKTPNPTSVVPTPVVPSPAAVTPSAQPQLQPVPATNPVHGPQYEISDDEHRSANLGPTRTSVLPNNYKGDWRDVMISQYEGTMIQRQRSTVYGEPHGPLRRKQECIKAWFSYIAGHGPVVWVRD